MFYIQNWILFILGYYGIQLNTQSSCSSNLNSPAMCYRAESLDTVRKNCESKSTCEIYILVSYFGDPCIGSLLKVIRILNKEYLIIWFFHKVQLMFKCCSNINVWTNLAWIN